MAATTTPPWVVATKNKEFDEGEDEDRQFQSERSLNHHQQQWRRQKPEQRIEDSCTGYSARGVMQHHALGTGKCRIWEYILWILSSLMYDLDLPGKGYFEWDSKLYLVVGGSVSSDTHHG
ncbi:hypothetical protein C4D60_Mb10t23470 [Musa balbisiana]|uniref:Uncharacterized protein n=1 Tax=Musa balbisiana TaxID=52838 RepID=A0A4S8J052_MUSBA|nr:hypothetical protein C4D60_Mb10t23470 [Musa balbisiana]